MLMRLLDDERHDFYLHIDAKVQDFDYDRFRAVPRHSQVTFVQPASVTWGGYSQIQSEINCLTAAVPGSITQNTGQYPQGILPGVFLVI